MGVECNYSYNDLFKAAYKRQATPEELAELSSMTQKERNEQVTELANLAKWQTRDKIGSDKQIYTAFAPKF